MINNQMKNSKPIHQQGFTLIELMISIVLGLLVIAAATAIFLSAQRSMNMQTGMSELQQNSIFGLSQITHDIRHLNLNTTQDQKMTKSATGAGIMFSTANLDPESKVAVPADKYTKQGETETNMHVSSDKLTIQFKPSIGDPNIKNDGLSNCEGTELDADQVNIQHYYLQPVAGTTAPDQRFNLMCDAGYRNKDGSVNTPLGTGAVVILQDVEGFRVRFVVSAPNPSDATKRVFTYKLPKELTDTDLIVGVEVGVLARSNSSVGRDSAINAGEEWKIAGVPMKLRNTDGQNRFLREAFTQMVAIRNAQGGN